MQKVYWLSFDPACLQRCTVNISHFFSIAALTVFSEMHQQDPRTRNRGKKRKAAEDISDNSEKVDDNIFEPGKRTEVIG